MISSSSSPDRRRFGPVALAVALSLMAAGCGGSSDGASPGASTSTTDGATPTTAATTLEETAAPAGEVATAAPVPSKGCGTSKVGSVLIEKQFLDDSDRWFLLSTPLEHDGETPLPLVVDFHGLLEGADVHSMMTRMGEYGDEHGFIVVQPDANGPMKSFKVQLDREANADLVFVDEMLDQLEAELCVDTSRVYATGLSNGGFITSTVACTMSDRFAAVAPVAGAVFKDGCEPSRPVPMLAFHGTEDPILMFNGGFGSSLGQIVNGEEPDPVEVPPADLEGPGYPKAVRDWAEVNGCQPTYTDTELSPTVRERTYDCPADGATQFVIVDGGGHSWPGSEFSGPMENIMGATDMSVDANELIWAFFQRFALPPDADAPADGSAS